MSQDVYNALLSRFISSDVEPGSKITIDALARELDVSHTPIREALGRLEMNGLVVRQLNAGYRIASKMTREQFENLVEIRLALEPLAARRAAERADPDELDALNSLANRMMEIDEVDGQAAYAMFAQEDSEFHDRIAAASKNELVRDALARLGVHVRLFRLIHRARILTDALAEHQAILDAVKSADTDAASYHMRRHILRSADRFRESFDAE
jgi:DNA-binding GntR family transcriptional regulator